MNASRVVESLREPALLLDWAGRPEAWSLRWAELFGAPGNGALRAPAGVPALVEALREGLERNEPVEVEAEEGAAVEGLTVRPVPGAPGGAAAGVLVVGRERDGAAGWHRRAVEMATTPTLLVGPRGRILFANRAARMAGPSSVLSDVSPTPADAVALDEALSATVAGRPVDIALADGRGVRFRPLSGLALVEVDGRRAVSARPEDPVAAPVRRDVAAVQARADFEDLTGHLEALRTAPLTRVQQSRLDAALAKVGDLAGYLGAPDAPADSDVGPVEGASAVRALVVDDHPINLQVAVTMLGVLGVRADAARDGGEALAKLGEAVYDLVFMDVMLPGADGLTVTREVRERIGDRPYIVGVTAVPDAEGRCLAAGMNAFLPKPLRLRGVKDVVRRLAEA